MWTYPPRSVLVPVDFGPASARALAVGQALAGRHAAAIVAMHAETLEVPPYFTHDQLNDVERQRAAIRVKAERYLEAFVRAEAPAAASVLTEGPAVEAIVAAAAGHDLIVMGTHGRRGPSRWWLGSVAERVVRHSPVPVLVVRQGEAATSVQQIFEHPVAVAWPAYGGEALRFARWLAEAFGGTFDQEPVTSLDQLTCTPKATVMVVTVGRHHGHAWFGDTAERLVRSCPLPMLFVPAQG
ncbi:MAG: universal stress protein [Acidobacteriota bacterium]